MSELAEGARLEIACTAQKVVPRVRIPLSPPNFASQNLARSRRFALQDGGSAIQIKACITFMFFLMKQELGPIQVLRKTLMSD